MERAKKSLVGVLVVIVRLYVCGIRMIVDKSVYDVGRITI